MTGSAFVISVLSSSKDMGCRQWHSRIFHLLCTTSLLKLRWHAPWIGSVAHKRKQEKQSLGKKTHRKMIKEIRHVFKSKYFGTLLAVQWLRFCDFTAGDISFKPGRGTRISHATQCGQNFRRGKWLLPQTPLKQYSTACEVLYSPNPGIVFPWIKDITSITH